MLIPQRPYFPVLKDKRIALDLLPGNYSMESTSGLIAALGSNATGIVHTKYGRAFDTGAGASNAYFMIPLAKIPKLSGSTAFSIHIEFITSFASSYVPISDFPHIVSTTSDNTGGFRIMWSQSNTWKYRLITSSGALTSDATPLTFAAGDKIGLTCTYDGANMRTYQNGRLIQTTAHTGTITESTHDLLYGHTYQSPSAEEASDAQYLASYIWPKTCINAAEVKAINDNLYSVYESEDDGLTTVEIGTVGVVGTGLKMEYINGGYINSGLINGGL